MILTAGELLVEFVSHEKDCGLAKTTTFSGPYPSGAPAIFADQVAKVGAKSAIIGCVGNDPFGEIILKRLEDDGVNIQYVDKRDTLTTGTAFVSYFKDGSRTFVFHLNNTAADQLPETTSLEKGTIFHISGASLANEKIRAKIMQLIELAKDDCQISYDPNIRPELMYDSSVRSCIEEIIEKSDFLLPSIADIEVLFPDVSEENFINNMLSRGKKAVIIKRGHMGAIGSDGGKIIHAKALEVDEVDPTGAGDCFCGAFIGLINQNYSFGEALEAANIAGALHVSRRGPMEWNPSLSDIQSHLDIVGA